MEKTTRSFKLMLQTGFTYNSGLQRISFSESPAGIIPALDSLDLEFNDFISHFIVTDEEKVRSFFATETWAENRNFFTVSTVPANYRQGESSSLLIHQQGKNADGSLFGAIINITAFMPAGMLYQDIERFAGCLPAIRLLTHDLNNQFQIITGFGSMLEDDLQDPEQKDNATQVMNAVNKSVDLVKELREFFPPKIKPRIFVPEQILVAASDVSNVINTTVPATSACPTPGESGIGILVIDDEPLVQRFLCEMLKRLKYKVMGCLDGHEAIQQIKENPTEYSLAIVDMNLPDINTEALLDQLKQFCPGLKVLLISGEDPAEALDRLMTRGANGFLQKPTTIKALGDAIVVILAK